jgi:phenylacetate-CoA ligase
MKSFLPPFNSEEELQKHQLDGLKWTVNHAYKGSPFYRRKLDDFGVSPNDINSIYDLRRLPFTTANDLA